ncbi:hypothetical protein QEW_4629 [Clostridioides difficile CD160]|nr:hypothetical protein QEW_4629 [Clostridioides difficile CD160]
MNNLTYKDKESYNNQFSEEKLLNLPEKEQLAIGICAKSFCIGGNWGYLIKDEEKYNDVVNAIGPGTNDITLYNVSNGIIVLCNRNYFKNAVNYLIPETIDKQFIDKINLIQEEEKIKFDKFLDSVLTLKSKYLKRRNNYYILILGAFCTNDKNIIRLNESEYPAYKLDLKYILTRFIKKNKIYKKTLGIKIIENNKENIINLNTETLNQNKTKEIYQALQIASSKTGAFVTITIY